MSTEQHRIDGEILPVSPELRAAQRERIEHALAMLREASANLPTEARRLLDEREILDGTGSKEVPRGVIALGSGPIRFPREIVDAALAEERDIHAAERAAVLARRQARRERRRPSSEIHLPGWNSPTLPG